MNYFDIREKISGMLGYKVRVTVYGMRNKKEVICGVIKSVYPNVFTILSKDIVKSFSYSDIFIGDVKIESL